MPHIIFNIFLKIIFNTPKAGEGLDEEYDAEKIT